jgi:putative PIN family toxin of toxin-antitoxin system
MQRIIVDTNVLISALIQRSYPNFIIYNYVLENLVKVCISEELFDEYLDVLNRPKFYKYPDFISKGEFVLAQLETKASKFYPTKRLDVLTDGSDNRLLELAVESKADFIITGNTSDFTMSEFQGTKIVTPNEYWDIHRE